jgi:hypothetical protein
MSGGGETDHFEVIDPLCFEGVAELHILHRLVVQLQRVQLI